MILVLGKARILREPNMGCRWGWVTWVIWCFTKKLCTRCDAWASMLSWWSCQSALAHSCSLLNHPNSFWGGMFKLNAKFDADSSLYSVFLNVMDTQYTWAPNGVYHPHWLVQWGHHCSHTHIPVCSPWPPGHIDVAQSVLVILATAGLFLDRPRMWTAI